MRAFRSDWRRQITDVVIAPQREIEMVMDLGKEDNEGNKSIVRINP